MTLSLRRRRCKMAAGLEPELRAMELDELILDKSAVLASHEFFRELPAGVIGRLASHA